ncbi:ubiquitin-related modifier 1, partial [Fomitiporia mediterranea MF3/22]|uniref:ubiquitin-related modifier 1 n=1 Tax=Fomitiporia mediterranea (strain MF3/22) TaxID=694068 RepID=UPI00044080BE
YGNKRSHIVSVSAAVPDRVATPLILSDSTEPSSNAEVDVKPLDVNHLLCYLRDTLLKERVELFMENETIRPGILVLINDSDWALEGEGDYQLKEGDKIVFISTLHGG